MKQLAQLTSKVGPSSVYLLAILLLSVSPGLHVHAQSTSSTLVAFEVSTQMESSIEGVEYDPSLTFGKTMHSIGMDENIIMFDNKFPESNLISGVSFTGLTRAADYFDLDSYPIRTMVKIGALIDGVFHHNCSGQLISPRHVLTAGHCLYSRTREQFFVDEHTIVAPVYDRGRFSTSFEAAYVSHAFVFEELIKNDIFGADIGILELRDPIGAQTGWLSIAFTTEASYYEDKVFHKFSYPGEASFFFPDRVYNGDTLYYDHGSIGDLDAYSIGVEGHRFAIPGQSGSTFLYASDEDYLAFGALSFSNDYRHNKVLPEFYFSIEQLIHDAVTGVSNTPKQPLFELFPTKVVDELHINFITPLPGWVHIRVFSASGHEVISRSYNNPKEVMLDLSGVSPGLHLVQVAVRQEIITRKVIKLK